jgi:hypothetical protein
MGRKFDLPLSSISDALLESIMGRVNNYTVGFLRVDEGQRGKDITLLGSGTLITCNGIHAILTAHHVIEVLPTRGELGLVYSQRLTHATFLTERLRYIKIARGSENSEGPDLGAVILPPNIVSMLSATKSFHNLDRNRTQLLTQPPSILDGLWIVQGFIAKLTAEAFDFEHRIKTVSFFELSSSGMVSREYCIGVHDYFDYPMKFLREAQPRDYGGTSGGGLWQVRLQKKGANGEVEPATVPILSGVAFYQGAIEYDRSLLKCHGRRSVYEVAYNAITEAAAATNLHS